MDSFEDALARLECQIMRQTKMDAQGLFRAWFMSLAKRMGCKEAAAANRAEEQRAGDRSRLATDVREFYASHRDKMVAELMVPGALLAKMTRRPLGDVREAVERAVRHWCKQAVTRLVDANPGMRAVTREWESMPFGGGRSFEVADLILRDFF